MTIICVLCCWLCFNFTQSGEFHHSPTTYSQKHPTPTFRENPTPNFWKAKTYSSPDSSPLNIYSVHTPATPRTSSLVRRPNVPTAPAIFLKMTGGLPRFRVLPPPVVSFRIIRRRRLTFGDFPPVRGVALIDADVSQGCTNPRRARRTFRDRRFPHPSIPNSEFQQIFVSYPIGTGWCGCGCWCCRPVTFGTVSSVWSIGV
mmetsp:Transcript_32100/g.32371  ORF Transcript_32100/g.32371 Transcript_32100/m.32371 type:complete len:201 (-) Transcript_32100:147-749(-)